MVVYVTDDNGKEINVNQTMLDSGHAEVYRKSR